MQKQSIYKQAAEIETIYFFKPTRTEVRLFKAIFEANDPTLDRTIKIKTHQQILTENVVAMMELFNFPQDEIVSYAEFSLDPVEIYYDKLVQQLEEEENKKKVFAK